MTTGHTFYLGGQVGESHQHLDGAVIAELDKVWRERITTPLGLDNYAAMIASLK